MRALAVVCKEYLLTVWYNHDTMGEHKESFHKLMHVDLKMVVGCFVNPIHVVKDV